MARAPYCAKKSRQASTPDILQFYFSLPHAAQTFRKSLPQCARQNGITENLKWVWYLYESLLKGVSQLAENSIGVPLHWAVPLRWGWPTMGEHQSNKQKQIWKGRQCSKKTRKNQLLIHSSGRFQRVQKVHPKTLPLQKDAVPISAPRGSSDCFNAHIPEIPYCVAMTIKVSGHWGLLIVSANRTFMFTYSSFEFPFCLANIVFWTGSTKQIHEPFCGTWDPTLYFNHPFSLRV